jgi:uncharacterized protein YdaU (DUF1376 family)
LNHYPRHVGDITQATFGLSLAEFGAYDRLLDAYYCNEAPLPLDAKERYRMAGAVSKADRKAVDYVVSRYFVEQADGWHQKRADEEIAAYRARADQARQNGAHGGRPRNPKITHPVTGSVNSGNPEITISKANQEPVTNNQKIGRASRLPAEWFPSPELRTFALKHLSPASVALETTKFKNHWAGVAGARGAKLDWDATFQNWVLNSLKYGAEPARVVASSGVAL